MDFLVTRLQERLQAIVRIQRPVACIRPKGDLWEIADQAGGRVLAKKVICACPTFAAAQMFAESDPELSAAGKTIPYAPIVVVATGHRRQDIAHPLDGFGFLIPRFEGPRTLGSIWTSSIFADRARMGHIQFRSMLGGAGDPGVLELSDEKLWLTLRRELDPLVGIRSDPAFMRVYRWERGIPQYTLAWIPMRGTRPNKLGRNYCN